MKKSLFLFIILLSFNFSCNLVAKGPRVYTYAGTGKMGWINGPALSASFSNLMGIAADRNGNIYVADSHNNLVRKISSSGIVTTLAGRGQVGFADGAADSASFFNPASIAVDSSGNVFVADTHNSLIREISPEGTVVTISGRIPRNSMVHTDSSVKYDNPMAIAVDRRDNLYVADWGNDLIRKIDPAGRVINLAGCGKPGSVDGQAANASFYLPGGIAVDSAGNVYVSDTYNNLIRKIDREGTVRTIAGNKKKGAADGPGPSASFSHPAGIAVDSRDNIYVADMGNNKIRKINPAGVVSTIAGSGQRGSLDGRDSLASFYKPYGVALGADGNLFVADYQNNLVRKIDLH